MWKNIKSYKYMKQKHKNDQISIALIINTAKARKAIFKVFPDSSSPSSSRSLGSIEHVYVEVILLLLSIVQF